MNFQEQMQNAFRTKDEVQEEAVRNLMRKIETEARKNYEMLKNRLLSKAEAGDYSIVQGQKVLTATAPSASLYSEYKAIGQEQKWFTAQIEDRSIQAVRDRKTRREITPYQFHNVVNFSLCPDAGQQLYMGILNRLGAADGIQIALVLQEHDAMNYSVTNTFPLPCTQYDMRESRVRSCRLAIQGIYRMPESDSLPEASVPKAGDVPKDFYYEAFVQELAQSKQKAQDEKARIQELEERLAEEKARKEVPISAASNTSGGESGCLVGLLIFAVLFFLLVLN